MGKFCDPVVSRGRVAPHFARLAKPEACSL
jgi:hypothetical protein